MTESFDPVRVHARQRFWQIVFPVVFFGLALLGVLLYFLLVGGGSGAGLSQWSNISTVFVILPWFLILLLVLAILIGFILLTSKIGPLLKLITAKIISFLGQVQRTLTKGANMTVAPVLKLNEWTAKLSALNASIHPQLRKGKN